MTTDNGQLAYCFLRPRVQLHTPRHHSDGKHIGIGVHTVPKLDDPLKHGGGGGGGGAEPEADAPPRCAEWSALLAFPMYLDFLAHLLWLPLRSCCGILRLR